MTAQPGFAFRMFAGLAGLAGFSSPLAADTVTAPGLPTAVPPGGSVDIALVVEGEFLVTDVNVVLSVDHPDVGELTLTLRHPDGSSQVVLNGIGTGEADLRFTLLDDEASAALDAGSGPFTADFLPTNSLGVFDGKQAAGTWSLEVKDRPGGATGTVRCVSLTFNGRTYIGAGTPAPILDFQTAQGEAFVAEDFVVADVDLFFDIDHGSPGDLALLLASPEAVGAPLVQVNTLGFVNLGCVTLDDDAAAPIASASGGSSGTWTTGNGGLDFFDGHSAGGAWFFSVFDGQFDDVGTLNGWWMHLTPDEKPSGMGPCESEVLVSADGANLGGAVALAGSTAMVGAEGGRGAGLPSVRVFELGLGGWSPTQVLQPPDIVFLDGFGDAIDLDGATALIGRPYSHSGLPEGSVSVYERIAGAWTETDRLPASAEAFSSFGRSLALGGDLAVVGSASKAFAFHRTESGWVEEQALVPEGSSPINFGRSLAISGQFAVVGARDDAFVFERTPTGWVLDAKLGGTPALANTDFGLSVAIEGTTVVVGASGDDEVAGNAGAAYVFEKGPSGWTETQKILAPLPGPFGFFGRALALDGGGLAVTAITPQEGYYFERSPTGWVELQRTALVGGVGTIGARIDIAGSSIITSSSTVTGNTFVYGVADDELLYSCDPEVSLAAGGTQELRLKAGFEHVGQLFFVLGSAAGTSPGLGTGMLALPLNFDAYFSFTLFSPNSAPLTNSLGFLDAAGLALTEFGLPAGFSPSLAGVVLNHAYVVLDGALDPLLVSNAVPVRLVP